MMKTSEKGLSLIKQFEGVELKAYKCPAGIATIGIGHTKGVRMGQRITMEQAESLLRGDVLPCEKFLNDTGIEFTQDEFDALVCFAFNLGIGALSSSTLLKKKRLKYPAMEIQKEFLRWVCAGGKRLRGLFNRRVEEAYLYGGKTEEFVAYANLTRQRYGWKK